MIITCFFIFLAITWLLAVVKVFVLDDGTVNSKLPAADKFYNLIHLTTSKHLDHHPIVPVTNQRIVTRKQMHHGEVLHKEIKPMQPQKRDISQAFPETVDYFGKQFASKLKVNKNPNTVDTPPLNPNPQPKPPIKLDLHHNDAATSGKSFSDEGNQIYKWPPVFPDGSIPVEDGVDVMPITKLTVPKFWTPPEGMDINTVGSHVNGQETIFLMIASYRDFQCRETITSAFMRADHPERLFIGAVDQVIPGDIGCLDLEVPCSKDNSQMICKYRDQISIYKMDAKTATGPVTARHVGDRMYRGQYYVMQMDAHCLFVRHWDTKIIQQFKNTHNEMAVLSSYLTDVQGSIDARGDSTRQTRPIMCNSDFEGVMPARYLRHLSQPEDYPEIRGMPQLQPFWAAGFSFSRGHFKIRVPYDAYQPMVFQGEEIAIGIRGFTYGYDFYAPEESVVFHEYADNSKRRKKIHMFWENSGHAGEGQKSLKRATAVIGMAPDLDPNSWDHSELDKYGLGTVRDLSLFYKLFLIDPKGRKATMLCPFVKTGIMHTDFQKFLRKDGLGIDYSKLLDYDTAKKIDAQLTRQHPYWESRLKEGMQKRDRGMLQEAINNAIRVRLNLKKPDLVRQAQEMLNSI